MATNIPDKAEVAKLGPVGPELVVGLIGPLGVDLEMLVSELQGAFASVSYSVRNVSLIEPVLEYDPWLKTPETPYDDRYNGRMTAGNEFRERLRSKDALAFLAVSAIHRKRQLHKASEKEGEPASPIPRCAYLLRSLKTPDEVETLREIYGPNFLAIAAYMPRKLRKEALMRKIAHSRGDPESRRHEAAASALLVRDEFEFEEYGQNIRDTYPLADFFIDVSSKATASRECLRAIEVVFGHPSHTPRKAESAMFHAYGAKLRSSSAGRQVGAAIVTSHGDLLCVGTNEVAKANGGQYWADDVDTHDQRDHRRISDSTSSMLSAILHDFLARMQRFGWLDDNHAAMPIDDLCKKAQKELLKKVRKENRKQGDPPTLGDKALLEKLIEYMRSVHAEMATLMAAARLGLSVRGHEMYVTTFPCHECARLIVAAGLAGVTFIEPYPKSRVAEMYDDSIVVDEVGDEHHVPFRAFVGIAPRRFVEFFEAPEPVGRRPNSEIKRRNDDGTWVRWETVKDSRWSRTYDMPIAIMNRELNALEKFEKQTAASGLKKPTTEAQSHA